MGALIGGIAVSTLVSAISGYMGSKAQAEAYEKLADATDEEKAYFEKAYDEAFGENSYNAKIQELGAKAGQQYYDLINDTSAWDKYINGSEAYEAPEDFSFTAEDLYSDPSYEFRLNSGLDALAENLASQGYAGSGYAAKEMSNYAQNAASQEYSNAYNRAYNAYTNDRDFDYNVWKNEANQYYTNLTNKLSGLDKVSSNGITANTNQTNALTALAGQEASAAESNARLSGAASSADTSATTSVLDAIAKGITYGSLFSSAMNGNTNNGTSNSGSGTSVTNTTSNDGWDSINGTSGISTDGWDYVASALSNAISPSTSDLTMGA